MMNSIVVVQVSDTTGV